MSFLPNSKHRIFETKNLGKSYLYHPGIQRVTVVAIIYGGVEIGVKLRSPPALRDTLTLQETRGSMECYLHWKKDKCAADPHAFSNAQGEHSLYVTISVMGRPWLAQVLLAPKMLMDVRLLDTVTHRQSYAPQKSNPAQARRIVKRWRFSWQKRCFIGENELQYIPLLVKSSPYFLV